MFDYFVPETWTGRPRNTWLITETYSRSVKDQCLLLSIIRVRLIYSPGELLRIAVMEGRRYGLCCLRITLGIMMIMMMMTDDAYHA